MSILFCLKTNGFLKQLMQQPRIIGFMHCLNGNLKGRIGRKDNVQGVEWRIIVYHPGSMFFAPEQDKSNS